MLPSSTSIQPAVGGSRRVRPRAQPQSEAEPRRDYLVAGAGVSGLAAAVLLARRGRSVELWEAGENAGGLLRPVPFRGVPCDLGSHRLHEVAHELLREAAPTLEWQRRPRRGVLVLNRRHIAYPLRLLGFLRGLGLVQTARLGWTFLWSRPALSGFLGWERDRQLAGTRNDVGFEQFVRARVGQGAYDCFYRPYAEKVWGIPPAELSVSVAKKRVSTSSPLETLRRSLRAGTRREDGVFLYPRLGMGALVAELEEEARRLGVIVRYGRPFTAADAEALGEPTHRWRAVLYGGHLDAIVPGTPLTHRGLYLLYLAFPRARLSHVDTYYVPEREYDFGRVSEVRNFSPALQARPDETVLCLEIPEGDWGRGVDFVGRLDEIVGQLRRAGILPPGVEPLDAHQVFLPRVYPMYRRGWMGAWRDAMKAVANRERIYPLGRQGLFLHCNIDHCVEIARDLVQHLEDDRGSAAWLAHATRYLDVRVRD